MSKATVEQSCDVLQLDISSFEDNKLENVTNKIVCRPTPKVNKVENSKENKRFQHQLTSKLDNYNHKVPLKTQQSYLKMASRLTDRTKIDNLYTRVDKLKENEAALRQRVIQAALLLQNQSFNKELSVAAHINKLNLAVNIDLGSRK